MYAVILLIFGFRIIRTVGLGAKVIGTAIGKTNMFIHFDHAINIYSDSSLADLI